MKPIPVVDMIFRFRSVGLPAALAAAASGAFAVHTRPGPPPRPTWSSCEEVACKSGSDLLLLAPTRRPQHRGHADCPANREELGAATWTFVRMHDQCLKGLRSTCLCFCFCLQLHSTAAYYPERPSVEEKAAATGLVDALVRLYPCVHCRMRLIEDVAADPPDVSSRAAFALWLCRQHNVVNEALGEGHMLAL